MEHGDIKFLGDNYPLRDILNICDDVTTVSPESTESPMFTDSEH